MTTTKQKKSSVTKTKESLADRFFPVPVIPILNRPDRPVENHQAIKKIIQGAVQGSYCMSVPDSYQLKYQKDRLPDKADTEEKIQFVTYLIESLQPQDAIEAVLASQFVITYIRGVSQSKKDDFRSLETATQLFEFGHQVLEALQKYRSKGAQQISVQYNVNKGSVVNIKNMQKDEQTTILEGSIA